MQGLRGGAMGFVQQVPVVVARLAGHQGRRRVGVDVDHLCGHQNHQQSRVAGSSEAIDNVYHKQDSDINSLAGLVSHVL
jgi:hypothetical protein